MVIHTKGFATSTGGQEEGKNLAYAYCVDESGYCLSVCRLTGEDLGEVMVMDQVNHRTREVAVELSREELRLRPSPAAAARLDGVTEYVVPLAATDDEWRPLDAALAVIFVVAGGGEYLRRP